MAVVHLSDFLHRLTRQMGAETLTDQSDGQLVERALDEFTSNQLKDAGTKERVDRYLKSTRVVNLRKVQK